MNVISDHFDPHDDADDGKLPVPQEVQEAIRTLIAGLAMIRSAKGCRHARACRPRVERILPWLRRGSRRPSFAHVRGSGRL
jgi:hypothetical protein